MKNKLIILVGLILLSQTPLVYGESYKLSVDEHSFDIIYSLDGEVIAMAIDKELTSLLVGTENVNDSMFEIEFAQELLDAENKEFAVLVNGIEIDYDITSKGTNNMMKFFVPADTEEIEIIGTTVIPEFPFGPMLILGTLITLITIFSRTKFAKFR